jgi:LysR family nitrogen assimilation transcriptional regulator
VPLFERTRHGMRPTAAGVSMADRARRALTELDRARAELAVAPGTVTGIVSIGLLESTAELLSGPLVSSVLRQHPGIELRILTAYSGHLQQWLDVGDLDLTLLYNLESTPSLNVQPLVREKLWVVAPAGAGLQAVKAMTVTKVATHPLVMPAPGHGLRALIDRALAQAQVSAEVAVQTNSMTLQKRLVQDGHGWTILPGAGITADVASGTLSAAPLSDPEVWRTIVLGMPRTGRATPAVEVIARLLAGQVRDAARHDRWLSAELAGYG